MRLRGLALIVVVGILGVLAMLAVAFVAMAQLERRASQQRVNAAKAYLLARSGIEDALARISAGQEAGEYGGEDWNGDGALNGPEPEAEIFKRGTLNTADCPVRNALRPSFFAADGLKQPLLIPVDSRSRGYSGRIGSDHYALKVEDESAKINVNGGFLDTQDRDLDLIPDHRDTDVRPDPADPRDTGLGWNYQLVRILNILGQQPEVAVPNLGTLAVQSRPAGGYPSIAALQKAIGTTKSLSPWLTVSSWIDGKVVHPNGYALEPDQDGAGAPSAIKKRRRPLALEQGGRPPVNLNAATRPVLMALIQDLRGRTWADPHWPVTYAFSGGRAGPVVDALIAQRPFVTWERFWEFCDNLPPTAISGMNSGTDRKSGAGYLNGGGNLCGADLLKANFDPNTGLTKQLPDQLLWRWIDKSDLTAWSTEGSLGSTGVLKLTSVGRVLGKDGRLLAERALGATVEAFSLLRQTTQRDFVAGRTDPQDYLSLIQDPLLRTMGASASWRTWGGTPRQGLGAMTMPCPPTALPAQAADFDGVIGLATIELDPAPPLGGTMTFLQHFDDGWDSENLGNAYRRQPGLKGADAKLQTDAAESVWPSPPREPGTLYPDGVHPQFQRGPSYQAHGNIPAAVANGIPSNHVVISYWVKPPVSGFSAFDFSCCRWDGGGTQFWGIAKRERLGALWGLIAETRAAAYQQDVGYERQYHQEDIPVTIWPGLRWQLVTALVDTNEVAPGLDVNLSVRGLAILGRQRVSDPTGLGRYPTPYILPATQDIAAPGNVFVIGGSPNEEWLSGSGANSVVDEFALCDFGDTAAFALGAAQAWANQRYAEGRYYKGGDGGAFLSGRLDPGNGLPVRLLSARWTAYLPTDPRMEIASATYVITVVAISTLAASGTPREVDRNVTSSVAVDLLGETDTLASPVRHPLAQGAPIDALTRGFRYRVTLKAVPQEPLNQPVLETPFFDDITFYYQPAEGPRILRWEDDEEN